MLFLRMIACYLSVIALLSVFVWQVNDPAAGFVFLFFAIGFIPSLIATIFVLMPIEIYFTRRNNGIARFTVTLLAGAVVPIVTLMILCAHWGQLPKFSIEFFVWSVVGSCWAFIWWASSWLFPTSWSDDTDI